MGQCHGKPEKQRQLIQMKSADDAKKHPSISGDSSKKSLISGDDQGEGKMAAMPRIVVLKSNYNDKYLRYIHEDVQAHGFLQFSGERVLSPYAKHEVEMAKCGKGLVHIRCCYNNKYWVRWSTNHHWIVAGADEPQEDTSLWSCTLFEPVHVDGDGSRSGDNKKLRFRHVQLNNYAFMWRIGATFRSCLFAGSASPEDDLCDVVTVIDWETLLNLPKHIAFKGDNGKYLSALSIEGHSYLQFASDDIGDPTVGNEVFTTSDGSVRIKSDHIGMFWRRTPNWIWADSDDTTDENLDTLFWPVKVGNNVVALKNLGNNLYCKRLTAEGKTDCLNAAVPTISKDARLEINEVVISRKVYNVKFRLMDARVYSQRVVTMATGEATNQSQEPNTVDIKLSLTETTNRTWSSNVSLKLGLQTNITAGAPLIAEGKIEISTDFTAEYQWGETESSTKTTEMVYKVTVPPMKRVRVSLIATKGSCDVPFSYTQRDTLIDGQQTTYDMDDGIYTGINCFDFKYETKQENL